MTEDDDRLPDTTLAFVDVLTNGLASMLVLFVLAALLQTQLEYDAPAGDGGPSADRRPFVLVAVADPPAAVPEGGLLTLSGEAGWPPPGTADHGDGYAVLALDAPPPPGAVVTALGGDEDSEITVEILRGDAATRTRGFDLPAGGRRVVWPPGR